MAEPITKPDIRVRQIEEIYVHVDVDTGYGWAKKTDEDFERAAKQLVKEIERHVDSGGAYVVRKYEHRCPNCNAFWTEDSTVYNWCCDEDAVRGAAFGEMDDDVVENCQANIPEFDKRVEEYRRRSTQENQA